MSTPPLQRIVVIGGGLAGMAAAVALHSAGLHVTLIEARRTLGGRAGSYEHPETGEQLDNCQHVLLGCCTNLIYFYQRLGVAGQIHWERRVRFRDERGRPHDLRGVTGLPAPLNLAPSLLGFSALTWPQRSAIIRAMTAMLWLGRSGARALADEPFGDWLDAQRQDPDLIRRFYDPILVSALNEETRRVSAASAIHVFQEAMLAHSAGYLVGVPACSLAQLYDRLPCDVRTGERVARILATEQRATAVALAGGQTIQADAIILATNYHAVPRLIPRLWQERDARLAHLDRLQSVPILGAHLWFDRPVMPDPHAALMAGPLQWLFRKDQRGAIVHGVISAARDWLDCPREQMVRQFEAQVRSIYPQAGDARLLRSAIVIEKRATFSPTPGSDRLRPPQAPPPGALPNLFLAGDYTATDWPATMEGAVRSGYRAADAVLRRLDPAHRSLIVPDLPAQWPARLAGLNR